MDKAQIEKKFDRKAQQYDKYASIQKSIVDELLRFLPAVNFNRILDIGCGTGYLTSTLKARCLDSEIVGIDISHSMLDVAKEKASDIEYICISAEDILDVPGSYDLVTSTTALHWVNDFKSCVSGIRDKISEDGVFYFSVPVQGSFIEIKSSFNRAYEVLNQETNEHVIPLMSMDDVLAIVDGDFFIEDVEKRRYIEYFASPKEALKSLKNIGGNYSEVSAHDMSARTRAVKEMLTIYEDVYRTEKGFPLTWEILFVGARKT